MVEERGQYMVSSQTFVGGITVRRLLSDKGGKSGRKNSKTPTEDLRRRLARGGIGDGAIELPLSGEMRKRPTNEVRECATSRVMDCEPEGTRVLGGSFTSGRKLLGVGAAQ